MALLFWGVDFEVAATPLPELAACAMRVSQNSIALQISLRVSKKLDCFANCNACVEPAILCRAWTDVDAAAVFFTTAALHCQTTLMHPAKL